MPIKNVPQGWIKIQTLDEVYDRYARSDFKQVLTFGQYVEVILSEYEII